MNISKIGLLSMIMIFAFTNVLSAGLCTQSGCSAEAQERVKYCLTHGCPNGRSPKKVCSMPIRHTGPCAMVDR